MLNHLSAIWEPLDEGQRQYHGVTLGILDLPALGRALKEGGFVKSGKWAAVTEAEIGEAVSEAGVADAFAPAQADAGA